MRTNAGERPEKPAVSFRWPLSAGIWRFGSALLGLGRFESQTSNFTFRLFDRILPILLLMLSSSGVFAVVPQEPRRVLNLDGPWQIAEGKMDEIPSTFNRKVAGSSPAAPTKNNS